MTQQGNIAGRILAELQPEFEPERPWPEVLRTPRLMEDWHLAQHRGPPPTMGAHIAESCLPGLGTIRACIDCGCLVAGGPTRCLRCGRELDPWWRRLGRWVQSFWRKP